MRNGRRRKSCVSITSASIVVQGTPDDRSGVLARSRREVPVLRAELDERHTPAADEETATPLPPLESRQRAVPGEMDQDDEGWDGPKDHDLPDTEAQERHPE